MKRQYLHKGSIINFWIKKQNLDVETRSMFLVTLYEDKFNDYNCNYSIIDEVFHPH